MADRLALAGELIAPDKVRTALKSAFDENYRPSLRDHFNPCRVYAHENEGGTLLCTYPKGTHEPAVPPPYAEGVWTGLEYMLTSHLILHGLTEEGLTIVRSRTGATTMASPKASPGNRHENAPGHS